MVAPFLAARVPQTAALSRGGIIRINARCFEFVARVARQPKVFLDGRAAVGFRDDMVNAEMKSCYTFRCATIAAAIPGRLRDALAQAARYARLASAHEFMPSTCGMRCPRYFSSK